MKDITLANLNMFFVRYPDRLKRSLHVPLGPLYLTSALEAEGLSVDFRDYQRCTYEEPFSTDNVVDFCKDAADIIGLSCMANLLPFTILAAKEIKKRYPEKTVIIGGVGANSVEDKIIRKFPWIDIVARGEAETTIASLVSAVRDKRDLASDPGITYRENGNVRMTPAAERIKNLDSISRPAYHRIDLKKYLGCSILTSRGCPYTCTFCGVAPIWNRTPYSRTCKGVIEEMKFLNREHGVEYFVFQDEFFVSSKDRVLEFSEKLIRSGLKIKWHAFARINLTDKDALEAMAESGCQELRYGIESGANRILKKTRKGFTIEEAIEIVSTALLHIPKVGTYFMWGFPFETMDDFHETVSQMIYFRLLGAKILSSLFCFLPQIDIYKEYGGSLKLSFYPDLIPEYMLTGHDLFDGHLCASEKHMFIYDFIREHPDIFPGFFLYEPEKNILPKFEILKELGFYLPGMEKQSHEEALQ